MGTLQAAIGGGRQGGGNGPDDGRSDAVPLEEVEQMQAEAMDGLREGIAKQIAEVEEDISVMKSDIQRQGDVRFLLQTIFFNISVNRLLKQD